MQPIGAQKVARVCDVSVPKSSLELLRTTGTKCDERAPRGRPQASAAAFFTTRNHLLIYALAGVVGVTSTLFRPALQAILPSLARTPEELIASNGASSTIESLGTLGGPLLAGVLVATADPGVVFA